MGTNFFWRFNICRHCNRYAEAHVGKSGFTWRGHHHQLLDPEHPDWGYRYESPFGFEIASVADWRKVFAEVPGELWDEYGRRIDIPLDWLDSITPPDDASRARKLEWWDDHNWWDPAGHHFLGCEFS